MWDSTFVIIYIKHDCHSITDLQIVNKIGSKLYKRSLPTINARITQSILVLWEWSGDRHAGTVRFWLWSVQMENVVCHETAVKIILLVSVKLKICSLQYKPLQLWPLLWPEAPLIRRMLSWLMMNSTWGSNSVELIFFWIVAVFKLLCI